MKKILGVYSAPRPHWVGDGFPVRSLFSYDSHGEQLEPVPAARLRGPGAVRARDRAPRGVGAASASRLRDRHHRLPGRGRAPRLDRRRRHHRPGRRAVDDGRRRASCTRSSTRTAFTRSGGTLEMVQLWVNLPAKDKMAAPGYQTLLDARDSRGRAGRRRRDACA